MTQTLKKEAKKNQGWWKLIEFKYRWKLNRIKKKKINFVKYMEIIRIKID